MRKCFFLLFLGLTSCVDYAVVHDQADQIRAQCEAKKRSGIYKNWVDISDCQDAKIHEIYAAKEFPHIDVIDLELKKNRAINEKLDSGKITLTEASALYDEARIAADEMIEARLSRDFAKRHALMEDVGQNQIQQDINKLKWQH